MSKKNAKRAGKKHARKGACTLPNSVAGVKLSKDLRDTVEPVLRWAGSPLVRETIAAALLAGANALTASDGKAALARRAAGGSKNSDGVGLAIVVAAGEIASRIVAAYQAHEAGKASSDRPAKPPKS